MDIKIKQPAGIAGCFCYKKAFMVLYHNLPFYYLRTTRHGLLYNPGLLSGPYTCLAVGEMDIS